MKDFFARLSWVDYIAAAFLIRGLYVGYKSGIFAEFLRTVSHLASAVTALWAQSAAAEQLTLNTVLNEGTANTIGFVAVFIAMFAATLMLRKLIIKVFKVGGGDGPQKILGAVLGAARWIVLLSLMLVAVERSPLKQLREDVQQRSLTGAAISRVAPALFGFTGQLTAQWAPPGQGKAA